MLASCSVESLEMVNTEHKRRRYCSLCFFLLFSLFQLHTTLRYETKRQVLTIYYCIALFIIHRVYEYILSFIVTRKRTQKCFFSLYFSIFFSSSYRVNTQFPTNFHTNVIRKQSKRHHRHTTT